MATLISDFRDTNPYMLMGEEPEQPSSEWIGSGEIISNPLWEINFQKYYSSPHDFWNPSDEKGKSRDTKPKIGVLDFDLTPKKPVYGKSTASIRMDASNSQQIERQLFTRENPIEIGVLASDEEIVVEAMVKYNIAESSRVCFRFAIESGSGLVGWFEYEIKNQDRIFVSDEERKLYAHRISSDGFRKIIINLTKRDSKNVPIIVMSNVNLYAQFLLERPLNSDSIDSVVFDSFIIKKQPSDVSGGGEETNGVKTPPSGPTP